LDQVVLLTPLLVLTVVLLLGFAGCDEIFGVPPPQVPFLTLRVRVPVELEVREIVFTWDPPNTAGDTKILTKPEPSSLDGADNLFDHDLSGEPDYGSWTVNCKVTVGGGSSRGAERMGDFTLEDSLSIPIATFQAVGAAADLAVTFVGLKDGAMEPA
jgi:hypothetical protein